MTKGLTSAAANGIRIWLAGTASVLSLLAGCGGPGAREHFYAFSDQRAALPAESADDRSNGSTSIAVAAVTVPEFVDRPQIVRRTAPRVVDVSEQNRWAEPLKIGIGRVTANELAALLTRRDRPVRATAYPQNPVEDVEWRVSIDVVRIDAATDGVANLESVWTIRGRNGPPRSGRSAFSCGSAVDPASVVAVWERLIRASAHDIAATIDRSIAPRPALDC